MANWALFQLGDGTFDGTQVLDASTLRALHRPVNIVAGQTGLEESPYLMYALGWMEEPYRGPRMIHHGGNIDGFSALVAPTEPVPARGQPLDWHWRRLRNWRARQGA